MCGIAGIADNSGKPVDEAVLRRMCNAIIHRGPDDDGCFVSSPETGSGSRFHGIASVGLGIRRLAIIDLATGNQPIHNEDKSVWVVLNGEIYNYPELRDELRSKGHQFYTQSDTEAIVHAYEEYGCDVPKRLRGMFAFALWDSKEERLLLARDRVGKKPLLYSVSNSKLIFASEFQSILQHPDVSREVDHTALSQYLSFMCVPAPLTAFRDVRKLEPGHTLIWQNGDVKTEQYWSLDFSNKIDIDEQQACERVVELLRDAVRVRLMSDVPLGAFLSGGIDSSAIVALMSELSAGQVKTFSIGFEEQDFSEIDHARRIADRFGTEHHEFVVKPDALEVLPSLVRHYGEPYADSSAIPTYYLSKLTRQHVTVALTGDGGDECFGGYERYNAMRIGEQYNRLPRMVRDHLVQPAIEAMPQTKTTRSAYGRVRRLLGAIGQPRAERYLKLTCAFNDELKARLCTPEFLGRSARSSALAYMQTWFSGNGELDIVDRLMMADTNNYLPNDLLVKVDIASMAVSLEARAPFLDHHLMEFAASLPASYKLRGMTTKYLLKRALKGLLPEENLSRRKMGFGVPISHWFRRELKGFLSDAILSTRALGRGYFETEIIKHLVKEHADGRRDYSPQLWTLLMLELWHREFID
ncbi:MAG TPA: asparagine synthase (glutamine-hydrolyzing) [Blastocatellia bacterium]